MQYGNMPHIPQTNYDLLAAKQEPYQKAYLLTYNTENILGKESEEWASMQKTKNKNKMERAMGADRRTREEKVKSNDSPEIPVRGETVQHRHPRPPFVVKVT